MSETTPDTKIAAVIVRDACGIEAAAVGPARDTARVIRGGAVGETVGQEKINRLAGPGMPHGRNAHVRAAACRPAEEKQRNAETGRSGKKNRMGENGWGRNGTRARPSKKTPTRENIGSPDKTFARFFESGFFVSIAVFCWSCGWRRGSSR